MARGGEAALKSGTTDELWGYFENLEATESAEVTEAMNGAGEVKAFEHTTLRTAYSGRFIWRADLNSPKAHVGDGTAITLLDTELATSALYITSATTAKSIGGGFMAVDFEGTDYPSLGS